MCIGVCIGCAFQSFFRGRFVDEFFIFNALFLLREHMSFVNNTELLRKKLATQKPHMNDEHEQQLND